MIYESRFISEMGCIDIGVKNHVCIVFSNLQHVVSGLAAGTNSILCDGSAQHFSYIFHHDGPLRNTILSKHSKPLLYSGRNSHMR